MFDLAEVGCVAPALALVDDEEPRHRPRLLAFVRGWSTSDLAHLLLVRDLRESVR